MRSTPCTGIEPVLKSCGLNTTATANSAIDMTTLATFDSNPPAATADANPTPCF